MGRNKDDIALAAASALNDTISKGKNLYVEENGKRKGFGFVQFDKEDSAMAAASALNDTISKGKNLYVSIFVHKSNNDNRLRIFSNTLNPALS